MAEPNEALSALRGLHLPPETVGADDFALAVLAGTAVALAFSAVFPNLMARRRSRTSALGELAASRGRPDTERLVLQAALLRSVARSLRDESTARLLGEQWLAALDDIFETTFFTSGKGRVFGTDLYCPHPPGIAEATDAALASLLRRLRA